MPCAPTPALALAMGSGALHRGAMNLRLYATSNPLHPFYQIRWLAVPVSVSPPALRVAMRLRL